MKNLKPFTSFVKENFTSNESLDERINTIFHHYLIAALWSSSDSTDGSEHLDSKYDVEDIDTNTVEKLKAKVTKFVKDNLAIIDEEEIEDSQLGHSLWLTQNRHGAGFMDLNLDPDNEAKLTKDAQSMGELNAFVNNDDKVYFE